MSDLLTVPNQLLQTDKDSLSKADFKSEMIINVHPESDCVQQRQTQTRRGIDGGVGAADGLLRVMFAPP